MAGAGFKDFAVGEVLTASDVDTYLMQQSVMRFADSAARGSALGTAVGTAVALAEGMVSYLDDANYVQVYNGTGWTSAIPGIGSNVVQAVKTDTFTTSSATFTDITGLSVTITPTSATSKVLVIASGMISNTTTGPSYVNLVRGSTSIYIGDAASSRARASSGARVLDDSGQTPFVITYLDSPASASAQTYKVQLRRGTSGIAVIGRGGLDADNDDHGRYPTSIIVAEVAA